MIFKGIAYVASPYSYLVKEFGLNIAIECAKTRCKKALEMGYIPLSSVLAFNGVYGENSEAERKQALADSLALMNKCDIFFYAERDLPLSEGMRGELKEWENRKKGKIICVAEL